MRYNNKPAKTNLNLNDFISLCIYWVCQLTTIRCTKSSFSKLGVRSKHLVSIGKHQCSKPGCIFLVISWGL